MSLVAAGAKRVLEEAFRAAGPDVFVSLHTADPGSTGANEQSGASYVRPELGNLTFPAGSVANVYSASNAARITFATPSADYAAAITHLGLWDASTAGTFYGGWALTRSITPQQTIPLYIDTGQFNLNFATTN